MTTLLVVTIKSRAVSGRIRVYRDVTSITLNDDGTTTLIDTSSSFTHFYTHQWTMEIECYEP